MWYTKYIESDGTDVSFRKEEKSLEKEDINMAVIKLTKDNFDQEVMQSDRPVLVDFYADWCGPCKMMSPVVEEIASEEEGIKVCKINIDSDIRLAITACIRQHFAEHPEHFDPRQYLAPARTAIKEMVKHKIINVLGSNDKA